jgi:hypothetical protein
VAAPLGGGSGRRLPSGECRPFRVLPCCALRGGGVGGRPWEPRVPPPGRGHLAMELTRTPGLESAFLGFRRAHCAV